MHAPSLPPAKMPEVACNVGAAIGSRLSKR